MTQFSSAGQLVVDPFSGAGTIPLEAAVRGRKVFCADISPYARILSCAKLHPPASLEEAITDAKEALALARKLPTPDLRTVPSWVRKFFHAETLREALKFSAICREPGREFLMACFLGILHHQRPGFLSFPSSHLVPYLRNKKYPEREYPEMYQYRELEPRLLAKIRRTYKRFEIPSEENQFTQTSVQEVDLPKRFDTVITSPPYMNALDYGRDNRLRLWFIDPSLAKSFDNDVTKRRNEFTDAIESLASKIEKGLKRGGYCIFIVGEEFNRSYSAHPSQVVISTVSQRAPSLFLEQIISDDIPDIRRTRKECKGVKTEHFLVFQRR